MSKNDETKILGRIRQLYAAFHHHTHAVRSPCPLFIYMMTIKERNRRKTFQSKTNLNVLCISQRIRRIQYKCTQDIRLQHNLWFMFHVHSNVHMCLFDIHISNRRRISSYVCFIIHSFSWHIHNETNSVQILKSKLRKESTLYALKNKTEMMKCLPQETIKYFCLFSLFGFP